jgi:CRP/FNR family cyclic AMP-dependent transcriptional regulator
MNNIDLIKNNELFYGFTDGEIALLAHQSKLKKFKKDVFIIQEGENSHEMFLIKQGKVNVMLNNANGKELILSTYHEGDLFGELSLLDGRPRSANVVALENCQLLVVHKQDFYDIITNNTQAALQIINYLCHKIRVTNSIAQSYALMDVYERLKKFLYSMAQSQDDGKVIIATPLTHKNIALKICTSREVVSRILRWLEKDQYVTVKNKIITIHKNLPSSI